MQRSKIIERVVQRDSLTDEEADFLEKVLIGVHQCQYNVSEIERFITRLLDEMTDEKEA